MFRYNHCTHVLDFLDHSLCFDIYISPFSACLLHRHDKSLPVFLRTYTAGAVCTRILTYGVELHQFTKNYDLAVEQLHELIKQEVYHVDYRGRWYDRLTLNLDHHLKQPSQVYRKWHSYVNIYILSRFLNSCYKCRNRHSCILG